MESIAITMVFCRLSTSRLVAVPMLDRMVTWDVDAPMAKGMRCMHRAVVINRNAKMVEQVGK
jgi:hypothetical protein